MTDAKPDVLPVNEVGIPFCLTVIPRWILWRYEQTEQGWAKVPRQPNGHKASSTNSRTWSSFDRVMEVYRGGRYCGIGLVLDGTGLACVDLDDALTEDGTPSAFAQAVLDAVPGYVEVSAGGRGLHIFTFTSAQGPAFNKDGPLEFYSNGRYIAVTGQARDGRGALDADAPPVDISSAITRFTGRSVASGGGQSTDDEERALLRRSGPLEGWDLERVRDELLEELDPDCSREEWLQVLMALHHQGEGGDDWLELAIAWSERGEKFVSEEDVIARWVSFQRDAGGISLATLIKKVGALQQKDHIDLQQQYAERIDMAHSRAELEDVICKEILESEALSPVDKDALAKVVQAKLKKTFQIDATIKNVRKLVIPLGARLNTNGSMPETLQKYLWVSRLNAYWDTEKRVMVSRTSMDSMHSREFPPIVSANSTRFPLAHEMMIHEHQVACVDDIMYLPGRPEVFTWRGLQWANKWRVTDRVTVEFPGEAGSPAQQAIQAARDHVAWMFPDPLDQRLLWSFLAYIVQNPGRRIHWALVLVGVEGTGKTLVSEMMREILSLNNCGLVDSNSITGNFTIWGEGHELKVIEELKMHGHNRYDAANKLKPAITNETILVEGKGVDARTVLNTASYLILTNHIDAVPLHDGDRRYALLESPRTRIEAALRAQTFLAFAQRFRAHPGAILYWLLGFDDWHPAFEPQGRAPKTDAKLEAIELSQSEPERVIQEVLKETGLLGIRPTVVAMGQMTAEAGRRLRDFGHRMPSSNTLALIMRNAGWRFFGHIKWRKNTYRIWTRGLPGGDRAAQLRVIRAELEASAAEAEAENRVTEDFDDLSYGVTDLQNDVL